MPLRSDFQHLTVTELARMLATHPMTWLLWWFGAGLLVTSLLSVFFRLQRLQAKEPDGVAAP